MSLFFSVCVIGAIVLPKMFNAYILSTQVGYGEIKIFFAFVPDEIMRVYFSELVHCGKI